jgi:phosphoribosylformylglycinamidine cyclo-ligase
MTVGEALLQPHVSYLRALVNLIDARAIKGLAHITGGGLTDNIPRILPAGTAVRINKGTWPVLEIFNVMQKIGDVTEKEMFRTFNMGIGMVIVCAPTEVGRIKDHLEARGEKCFGIGEVIEGNGEVIIN